MDLKVILICVITPIVLSGCGAMYKPVVWDKYNEGSENLGIITTINNYDRAATRSGGSDTVLNSITDESGKKIDISYFPKYILAPQGQYTVTYRSKTACKEGKCQTKYHNETVLLKAKRCHVARLSYPPVIRYQEQSSMRCEDNFIDNGDGSYSRGKEVCKPTYITRTKQGPVTIKTDEYELSEDNKTCLFNKEIESKSNVKVEGFSYYKLSKKAKRESGDDFKKLYFNWIDKLNKDNEIILNGKKSKDIIKYMLTSAEKYCEERGLDFKTIKSSHGSLIVKPLPKYEMTCSNRDEFVGLLAFWDYEDSFKVKYSTPDMRGGIKNKTEIFKSKFTLNGPSGYIIDSKLKKINFIRVGSLGKRTIVGVSADKKFLSDEKLTKIVIDGNDLTVTSDTGSEYIVNSSKFLKRLGYREYSGFGCCGNGLPLVHYNEMTGKYSESNYDLNDINAIHFNSAGSEKLKILSN